VTALLLLTAGGLVVGMAIGAYRQPDLRRKPLVVALLGLLGVLLVVAGMLRL
jgi:hypothetical protein